MKMTSGIQDIYYFTAMASDPLKHHITLPQPYKTDHRSLEKILPRINLPFVSTTRARKEKKKLRRNKNK